MTDKQLHVLLDGLLDELADAIAAAETSLATVGDEREKISVPIADDGTVIPDALTLSAIGARMRGNVRFVDDPDGDLIALAALQRLHERWTNRVVLLMDGVVIDEEDHDR